jgi:hypothetical protein
MTLEDAKCLCQNFCKFKGGELIRRGERGCGRMRTDRNTIVIT